MRKLEEYLDLLDQNLPEQNYQTYFEKNTEFIPRHFLNNHDVQADIVLSKLKFGGDYTCDFFYLTKSSSEWYAVFIEIEKPSCKFFTSRGDLSAEFNNAVNQIGRWKSWLSHPENQLHFRECIDALLFPVNMARNPINYKYILVYGRNSEYTNNQDRIRLLNTKKSDDFEIMSYDRLSNIKTQNSPLNIGSRHNEYISIKEDVLCNPDMFLFCTPSKFEVSKQVRDFLAKGRTQENIPEFMRKVIAKDKYIEASKTVRVRS